MAFWWPVIGVWPTHPIWSRWAMIPYLLLADLVNTGLSAVLSFSDHVFYPTYQLAPRLWGISALSDQAAAGAIMWVPGSIAFLVSAMFLGMHSLAPRRVRSIPRVAVPLTRKQPPWDLLRIRMVGPLLRFRYFR